MKSQKAIVLIGGNQGEVYDTMMKAIAMINDRCGRVIRCSSVYTTQAWGPVPQPDFLNMIIEVSTILTPGILLERLLETETRFGRRRTLKYGPRTLDLDILFYGSKTVLRDKLKIPHPEMQNRRFVLVPLVELMPGFRHPVLKRSMSELLKICPDKLEVSKWKR